MRLLSIRILRYLRVMSHASRIAVPSLQILHTVAAGAVHSFRRTVRRVLIGGRRSGGRVPRLRHHRSSVIGIRATRNHRGTSRRRIVRARVVRMKHALTALHVVGPRRVVPAESGQFLQGRVLMHLRGRWSVTADLVRVGGLRHAVTSRLRWRRAPRSRIEIVASQVR